MIEDLVDEPGTDEPEYVEVDIIIHDENDANDEDNEIDLPDLMPLNQPSSQAISANSELPVVESRSRSVLRPFFPSLPHYASTSTSASTSSSASASTSASGLTCPTSTTTNQTSCFVCWFSPATHIVIPCGHLGICGGCANHFSTGDNCPLCRNTIDFINPVFFTSR